MAQLTRSSLRFRVLPLLALAVVASACSSSSTTSDVDPAAGGQGGSTGGKAGAAGQGGKAGASAGTGGQAGSSGQAGQSGQAGKGGQSGAGAGGASGTAGASGKSGSSGQSGQAGKGGVGGQAGAGGNAGSAAAGQGGSGPCSEGQTACGDTCVNTQTDPTHCGDCATTCGSANGTATCDQGKCGITCDAGFFDCDGDLLTGCEATSDCACKPGEAVSCYEGPAATENVGTCKAGTKTCLATGQGYGPCEGQVLPAAEICAMPGDEDCDGQANEEGADCTCLPGATQTCTTGEMGLFYSNVDPNDFDYSDTSSCKKGTQTCKPDGSGFTACVGAVGPKNEDCATAEDDNCNKQVNEPGPNSNCACQPGETKDCYDGLAGTKDVGPCKGGTSTCKADGSGFGPCAGQVVPGKEICDGQSNDENCNGQINEMGGDPSCVCPPNTQAACYSGPPGTAGVGVCKTGTKTCSATGQGYGPCEGEVVPSAEVCAAGNTTDENCNGKVNETGPGSIGCLCDPGSTTLCYDNGLDSPQLKTSNGICAPGFATCDASGTAYGACANQVLPSAEVCDTNGVDEDCDGQSNEGGSGCECLPGASEACWDGPPSSVFGGNSICKKGSRTCQPSGKWGACLGQTLPSIEPQGVCTANLDEDCNGDSLGPGGQDLDGDGWTACGGDCCETTDQCTAPKLVNPGAFDVGGNNLDDDCDGVKDNAPTSCDSGLASNSGNALDYAKAMDICQTTTENDPLKKWGVISAQFLLADGTGAPNVNARAIRTGFGTSIKPKKGSSFAVLSTGTAADTTDTSPSFTQLQYGTDMGTTSAFPADWFAANGNNLPNTPGCPGVIQGGGANDPVMLKLRIRVPTNAQSFNFNSYFLSAEFPEWVCSRFNDFFVALLNSSFAGQPANPVDRNLAFYDPLPAGPPYYPVGINLAYLDNGLFRVCKNGTMACAETNQFGNPIYTKALTSCVSNAELAGTGYDPASPATVFVPGQGNVTARCQNGDQIGGATGYLTSNGNVKPGEIIEIRFAIWDTADHYWDASVLLDNWTWSLNAAQPGTVISQ